MPSCRLHAPPFNSPVTCLSARQPLSSHRAPAIDRAAADRCYRYYARVFAWYLPVCTRAYAHALRAATESETSNFDHEQIGTMGWNCKDCNIQVEPGSKDTSQCAVSHNYLRTRAILTLRQILHSSHCTVFFFRMYAFLDNTSLFYSCSFVDVVFADLYLCISGTQRILTHFLLVFVCRR